MKLRNKYFPTAHKIISSHSRHFVFLNIKELVGHEFPVFQKNTNIQNERIEHSISASLLADSVRHSKTMMEAGNWLGSIRVRFEKAAIERSGL